MLLRTARHLESFAHLALAEPPRLSQPPRALPNSRGRRRTARLPHDTAARALEDRERQREGVVLHRPPADEAAAQHLTIELLEHQLEHPGAMVRHRGRTHHSACFRRFILTKHDEWLGCLESFAAAVRVPLDTLRDWLRCDREAALDEPVASRPAVLVPREASELTSQVAEFWQAWEGPTRAFIGQAAGRFGLPTD